MSSLALAISHLKYQDSPFIKYTTKEELQNLQLPHEHTGLPIYKVVQVFLTEADRLSRNPFFMIFVDNGTIYYCNGDVLEHLLLDEPQFYTNSQDYDYEEIFSAYFLDSSNELASFAGFFFLS